MIRLSLPRYNPAKPLTLEADVRLYSADPVPANWVQFFRYRFWADGFAQDHYELVESFEELAAGWNSFALTTTFQPGAVGLSGDEGWFSLDPLRRCFVTDLRLTYTPATTQGARFSDPYFS